MPSRSPVEQLEVVIMALGVHSIPLPLRYLFRRWGPQTLMILGAVFLYWGLVKKGVLTVREWFQEKARGPQLASFRHLRHFFVGLV